MIHIFDVDHTVIRNTSAKYFLFEALNKKLIKFSQVRGLILDSIKYKLNLIDNDFIENTIKNLAGIEKDALVNVSKICFEKKIKQNIYKGAAQLVMDARDRGEKVIFATSSLDFIIQPLEFFLGIEGSLATRLDFIDGRTTGNLAGQSLFGIKKKEAVLFWMRQNNLEPADLCFYSDSYTDIPLLEYCGNPVAVNPDRILAREAKKCGWKILIFKEML